MTDICNIVCPLTKESLTFNLLKNDNCVCEYMRKDKYWEKELCELMYSLVHNNICDDNILLDIGCFIGTHTVPLAKKFTNNKIISIEANPVYSQIHLKNLHVNKCDNVTHINSIVTSSNLLNKLKVPTIDYSAINNYGGIGVVKTENVSSQVTITLDSLNLKNVCLIKLDVEGHELEVLNGGVVTITNSIPLIFIEIWSNNLINYIRSDIFKKMFNLGYSIYKVKFSIMDYVLIHKTYTSPIPLSLEKLKI